MLINVPFMVISLIKTVVVKIHKLHKMYNSNGVNISQCFHNTLIIIRLGSCQVLNISFLMLYINKQSLCLLVQSCLSGQCIQIAYNHCQYWKGSRKDVT